MATEPTFITLGTPKDKIDVLLSYRIVELFSEGLYASPNKALEELVANSFDAGAQRVLVIHSANLHDQDATIAVMDDGDGMGVDGLKQHWLIGVSNKDSRRAGNRLGNSASANLQPTFWRTASRTSARTGASITRPR